MAMSSYWPKALLMPSGARVIVEVIIDPDGRHIKLDGYRDIISISPIINTINIDPLNYRETILNDLYITFNDFNEFLLVVSERSEYRPFRIALGVLRGTPTATEAALNEYGNFPFQAGDRVVFTDGVNSDTVILTDIGIDYLSSPPDYPWSYWQTLEYASGSLSNSYAAGDIVMTDPIYGSEVLVQVRVQGLEVSGAKTVFRGIIREPFNCQVGKVTLKVDNLMGQFLMSELKIISGSPTPTQRCDSSGSLASTLTWTKTGSGTLSGITVYADAILGEWTVTFSDAANFTVSGPNCKSKAGSTGADFYDQTDATDSQICIPSANWGGVPDASDLLIFNVSVNFDSKTVPEIIYSLLSDYAGISDSLISVHSSGITYTGSGYSLYSFNKVYNELSSETMTFSFDQPITIGEAIGIVKPHGMVYLFQQHDGVFGLDILKTDYYNYQEHGPSGGSLPGTESVGAFDFYNEFVIQYGFDYSTQEYQHTFVYPHRDVDNTSYKMFGKKRSATILLPGFYTEAEAEKYAKRYWAFWAFGVLRIESDWPLSSMATNIGGGNTYFTGIYHLNDFNYHKIINTSLSLLRGNRMRITAIDGRGDIHGAWS